jgi:fatty-acyl-CoA synthase
MPKVAQHKYSGMIYNGWIGTELLFTPEDNIICPCRSSMSSPAT